jgi:anaerobic magnesium-protoporphyrin IX monomethyl ester cyclase
MQELVNGAPLREIRGISYLKDGKVVHNPVKPLIADLDTLPFPRRDLVKLARYHYLYIPADVVETSRGCVYKCTFCCITKFYSHTYRTKSVTRVIEEIKRIDENKKLIFFVDDNFTLNMARVHNICEEICNAGISKWFACQSRVDTIARYPDVVAKMADAGFKLVFLGVESIHQKSLDLMQKKTRTEQLNRAIEILHDNGMMVYGSFIIGNLGETRADVEHMIEKIKAIDIDIMQAQPLTPFPGTQLYEDAKRNNWFKDGNELWWENWDFRAVMATPDLTCEDIDELVRLSLKKFYYNWRWYFGKSKWKRLLHPKFRWWWEIGSRFIWEGAKNFILKLGRE